jgi:hypothetical protein
MRVPFVLFLAVVFDRSIFFTVPSLAVRVAVPIENIAQAVPPSVPSLHSYEVLAVSACFSSRHIYDLVLFSRTSHARQLVPRAYVLEL